jgi:hypothetical protein
MMAPCCCRQPLLVGVLGCMAERLKAQLLDSKRLADLVVGPDAYRDLPRILAAVHVSCHLLLCSFCECLVWFFVWRCGACGSIGFVVQLFGV